QPVPPPAGSGRAATRGDRRPAGGWLASARRRRQRAPLSPRAGPGSFYPADAAASRFLDAPGGPDLTRPTAWLFGNEAWGLPDELLALADDVVAVPIYGQAESLNLAAAAAVCLYASARQLRAPRGTLSQPQDN